MSALSSLGTPRWLLLLGLWYTSDGLRHPRLGLDQPSPYGVDYLEPPVSGDALVVDHCGYRIPLPDGRLGWDNQLPDFNMSVMVEASGNPYRWLSARRELNSFRPSWASMSVDPFHGATLRVQALYRHHVTRIMVAAHEHSPPNRSTETQ